jgi:hypothetical protein
VTGDSTNRLYDLLPRIIRLRDLEEGGSLLALLQVLERQRLAVEADIERLYDDVFIETCADWVVPHIGALIDAAPDATRAEVANTLRRRRRPGLLSTLVELARDVTGCAAEAREVLPDGPGGGPARLELTVYITDAMPICDAEAREVEPGCFTVHPMGVDTTLYRNPSAEPDDHPFVPLPLHRHDQREDVARHVRILAGDAETEASRIELADLSGWTRPAERGIVCLDPELGRISFAPGDEPQSVRLDYAYGARADIGGGPYPRGPLPGSGDHAVWEASVERRASAAAPVPLAHALDRWADDSPQSKTITIADSGIHHLGHRPSGGRHRVIDLGASESLVIRAEEGYRPCLIGDLVVLQSPRGKPASFVLDGCLLEGTIRVHGDVEIVVRHCTVRAPDAAAREGEPAIHLPAEDDAPTLHVTASVVGPLRLATKHGRTEIEDSVVDAPASPAIAATSARDVPDGYELTIRRSTILGSVRAPHAESIASPRPGELPADTRFGQPQFPGPHALTLDDLGVDGFVAVGARASRPVSSSLARLDQRLKERLPLDIDMQVVLV